MTSLLLWVLGSSGLLVLVAIGLFFLIGPAALLALLHNKYFLAALAFGLALAGGSIWWQHEVDKLHEEGAATLQAANDTNTAQRRTAISEYVVAASQREIDAHAVLRDKENKLDLALINLQQVPHVSKAASAACTLSAGFVWDHDAAVPGTGGRTPVPPSAAASDKPSGVALVAALGAIQFNYSQCAKLAERIDSAEAKRYADCVAWDTKYGTASNCTR
jgi:hypothetical protein